MIPENKLFMRIKSMHRVTARAFLKIHTVSYRFIWIIYIMLYIYVLHREKKRY